MEKEMAFDEADDNYRFIANPRHNGEILLFDHDEAEDVKFINEQPLSRVWTVYDDLSIASGYHVVNRLAYLISELPVQEGTTIFSRYQ